MTTEEKKVTLEDVVEVVNTLVNTVQGIAKEVAELKKSTVKKSVGLFGGNRTKTAIKDTKTGKVYPSKANVGKMLGPEFGCAANDNFAWYKIIGQAPDRFVNASAKEAEVAWREQDAALQKSVDEANKKIAAEEAAAKKGKK